MNEYELIMETLRRYNSGELELNDTEAEQLAMQAKAMGERFKSESKPLQKGLFDFGDMAAFGLLPDEWRPVSQGQNVMGETGIDKIAGTIGSLGGLVTGAVAATKGAKMGWNAIKKTFARKKADDIATNIYRGNIAQTPKMLTQGRPLSLPGGPRTPQLPGGGRYPLQTTPRVGDVGRSLEAHRRRLEEAMAAMRANPLPRYQTGGYNDWEPDMMDPVVAQAPRLSMREASERQQLRNHRDMMQRQGPWGSEGDLDPYQPSYDPFKQDFLPGYGPVPEGALEGRQARGAGLGAPTDRTREEDSLMNQYLQWQQKQSSGSSGQG